MSRERITAGLASTGGLYVIADYQTVAGRTGADLYTLSLYIMVRVLAVGFVANLLVRPVDPRFHMQSGREEEREKESTASGKPLAANRRRNAMSEEARQESGGQTSSSSMVLVVVLWAMVLIPLAWGTYQTLTGVVALFTG